jgi:hypothetical protein
MRDWARRRSDPPLLQGPRSETRDRSLYSVTTWSNKLLNCPINSS